MTHEDKTAEDDSGLTASTIDSDDQRSFAIAAIAGGGVIVLALALAALLKTPFTPQLIGDPSVVTGLLVGILGAGPLIVLLLIFMRIEHLPIAKFRDEQISFLSAIGFRLTMTRIVLISMLAGVGEELLFRGVFQTALTAHTSLVIAIVLPNILFGLLHARSAAYALIAGFAGVYFGVLFAASETLIAPITAHGVYDFAALGIAQKAINDRRETLTLEP